MVSNMPDDLPFIGACHNAFEILLSNGQSRHPVDEAQLMAAARTVLEDSDFSSAMISLAVVDDPTMQDLNKQFLNHDWPTDVLSFALQDDGIHLEGEVIISADTAAAAAQEVGCTAAAEQLLYVIHGMLHLIGYRDKTADDAKQMRLAEASFLSQFGWETTFRSGCGEDPAGALDAGEKPDGATTL
jgi:probable rRNA maturation factor